MASVTGDAAGGAREAPSLFLRNATGLVKGWSSFDAFVYAFMSVNLVTLGMYYSFTVFGWVADGSPIASILLTAVAMTFLCITYAGLIAVMPRAGGDYVWQTRVLDGPPGAIAGAVVLGVGGYLVGGALALGDIGALVLGAAGGVVGVLLGLRRGGIGFVLSATGWWLILALWAPIYGAILNIEFVQPLAALAGLNGVAEFFATSNGVFAVSLIVIGLVTVLVALGMAGYARIQRLSLYIGLIALAVMFVLMLISSQETFQAAFDREAQSLWGVSNAYQATIDAEAGFGYVLTDLDPLGFGPGTLLLIPLMLFWILYPNWGATLYGEVRGASDFRRVLNGMLAGTWVAAILAIVFVLLAAKTFGWVFFQSTNVNYLDPLYAVEGAPDPVIPIWGYPVMLASFLVDSRIFQIVLVVLAGAWFLGWAGTLFLSSTRMIFAAAFDRILPEAAARVSDRGVPWVALLLIMVPSVVLSWFYAYNADFVTLTLDATLVIAVTFLGSAFAATILPWWKRDLYEKSAMARYQIGGLPVLSIAGGVTTIFLAWVLFQWLSNPLYGIGVGNTQSIIFLGILYGVAALIYIVARLYRRSQGINLETIHAEIPAE
ncbi:MAG TPA: amino acid permease [Candidatus Limnocylindrales bacterium]|nr:amino acid permease [Candidatus Limnocylindrales bacterium]